jgi:tetratricopeptide (TPR) repeat protein
MPDKEPTPEFNDRCKVIITRWEAGELPFREAAQQMDVLLHEALAARHLANQARVELLLGVMQGYRANLNVSIKHFEKARDLFARVGNETRVVGCDLNLGEAYRQKGDFTEARRLFTSAYEAAKRLNDIQTQTIAVGNTGQMLLSMGQMESATNALKEALELARRWPDDSHNQLPAMLSEIHHALAMIHLRAGRKEAAWEEAKKAVQQARASQQPLTVGFANRTLGEVLLAFDSRPDELDDGFSSDPADYFRAAIQAFQEIDAEGERARTMHGLAKCLAKQGRRVAAARLLQQAMLIFAKLGMVDDSAKAAESQAEVF